MCIPPIINYLISTVFNQENGECRFDSIRFESSVQPWRMQRIRQSILWLLLEKGGNAREEEGEGEDRSGASPESNPAVEYRDNALGSGQALFIMG